MLYELLHFHGYVPSKGGSVFDLVESYRTGACRQEANVPDPPSCEQGIGSRTIERGNCKDLLLRLTVRRIAICRRGFELSASFVEVLIWSCLSVPQSHLLVTAAMGNVQPALQKEDPKGCEDCGCDYTIVRYQTTARKSRRNFMHVTTGVSLRCLSNCAFVH